MRVAIALTCVLVFGKVEGHIFRVDCHVIESLRRHFGHTAFRPGQEEVVRAMLEGRDVLPVMTTGSGKSLGFQLPAVLPAHTCGIAGLLDSRPAGDKGGSDHRPAVSVTWRLR